MLQLLRFFSSVDRHRAQLVGKRHDLVELTGDPGGNRPADLWILGGFEIIELLLDTRQPPELRLGVRLEIPEAGGENHLRP